MDPVASLPDDLLDRVADSLDHVSLFRAGTVCRAWRSRFRSRAAFFLIDRNNVNRREIVGNADATVLLPAWHRHHEQGKKRWCATVGLIKSFGASFRRIDVPIAVDSFDDFETMDDPNSCFRHADVLTVLLRKVRFRHGFEQRAMAWMSGRVERTCQRTCQRTRLNGGNGETTLLFGTELVVRAGNDSCKVMSSGVPKKMADTVVDFLQRHRFETVDLFCVRDPGIDRFGVANVCFHPLSCWKEEF